MISVFAEILSINAPKKMYIDFDYSLTAKIKITNNNKVNLRSL